MRRLLTAVLAVGLLLLAGGTSQAVQLLNLNQDVGAPGLAGSASFLLDEYTITGGGNDIWNDSDNFHFMFDEFYGDGTVTVRVKSYSGGTNGWRKFGPMIRNELTGPSINNFVCVAANQRSNDQSRDATGANTWRNNALGNVTGITVPYWLRLERSGDTFHYWRAPDVGGAPGVWTDAQYAEHTTVHAGNVFVGLAVTSHDDAETTTGVFDNLTLTGFQRVEDVDWMGTVDTFWDVAGNWTPPAVPTVASRVALGAANTDTVTVRVPGAVANSLTVDGGGIKINDGQALSIAAFANFAPGTTFEIGDGATLSAGDGQIPTVATSGDPIMEVTDGTVTVGNYNHTPKAANTMTKQGPGTLAMQSFGSADTTLRIANGTLEILGTPTPTLAGGEIGLWTFDNFMGDTIINEGSAMSADGTLTGDASLGTGLLGNAVSLDGNGDYVALGNPSELDFMDGDFTLAAWIKTPMPTATIPDAGGQSIISKGANWDNDARPGIRWYFDVGENGSGLTNLSLDDDATKVNTNGTSQMGDDVWHHVVAMREGRTVRIYVDGKLETDAVDTLPDNIPPYSLDTSAYEAYIGAIADARDAALAPARFFQGQIDDVAVYGRALGAAEIDALAGMSDLDMTTHNVEVTGTGTLKAGAAYQADFGTLTMFDGGRLTTAGIPISFNGAPKAGDTVIDPDADAVGFDPQTATDYGVIDGSGADVVISKFGNSNMRLSTANENLSAATWRVEEGLLSMVDTAPWGGSTAMSLDGGTFEISGIISPVVPADAIGVWTFDNVFGSTVINEGSAGVLADGTLEGSAAIASALVGDGVLLADGDAVNVGNNAAVNFHQGDWSMAAWVQSTNSGTGDDNKGAIFADGGDHGGGIRYAMIVSENANGPVTLLVDDNANPPGSSFNKQQAQGSIPVNDGPWHHVVGVRDGGQLRLYIDGELDASQDINAAYDLDGIEQHPAYIGAITDNRDGSLMKFFNGLIDEVSLYGDVLTDDEITGLMGFRSLDLSTHSVEVTGAATLLLSQATDVALGPLTMKDGGILTTSGAAVTFNGAPKAADTTVDAAAAAVGFDPQTGTDLGVLDGSNAGAVITKYGGGELTLSEPNLNLTGSVFDAQGGQLRFVQPASLADAALQINGGEVILGGGAKATYDNPLEVIASGALTAEGGEAVLGSAAKANGVTLTAGVLTMQAAEVEDALTVAGSVIGTGGIAAPQGTVTLQQTVDVGTAEVDGGDLTAELGATIGTLDMASGTFAAGADLNVTDATVSGGAFSGLDLGQSDMVLSNSLTLGPATYTIADAKATFKANGSDLLGRADLTVSGGVLSAAGQAGGAYVLDPDATYSVLLVTGDNNGAINGDEQGFVDHFNARADAGFTFDTVGDAQAPPANAEDYDLLFFTSDVDSTSVNDHAPTSVPVLMSEEAAIDKDWRFSDSGHNNTGTTIDIVDPNHPIATGLSGTVTVFDSDQSRSDANGTNAPGMDVVAVSHNNHPTVFVFEEGAELTDGSSANSRRVYMFFNDHSANLTADGWTLFDQATNYLLGAPASATVNQPTTNFIVSAEASPTSEINVLGESSFGNLTILEGVTELTLSGSSFGFVDVTTPQNTTINGLMSVAGNINIGGSPGLLTVNASGGAFEFGEDAVYNVEIGEWDSPGGLPPQPPLPDPPMDASINDRLHATAGDVYLDGSLTLKAITKLHPRTPHPDPPNVEVEWYGDQTRVIVSAVGEAVVGWTFAGVPDPQPESWDNLTTGTPEWSQGHIGRGVFLTRQNDGGENDVPGISYGINTTKLHLFQACDGDTNGDRTLGGRDIQNIQSFGLFGILEDPGAPYVWPPDWSQGDFDGDGLVTGLDISAILATGLWPTADYAAIDPGEPLDGVVDLLLYPQDVTLEDGTVVPAGTVMIDPDGLTLNGYVLRSAEGIFTGAPAQQLNWFFVEDTDRQISGNMGATIVQVQDLGAVIGPEWMIINPFEKQDVNPFDDLTLTYTVAGTPGTFVGNLIIVPEPSTIAMLIGTGALGLLWLAVRRRRKA